MLAAWSLVDEDKGIFSCDSCGGKSMGGSRKRRIVKRTRLGDKPGYRDTGFFCSLNCGHNFGVELAMCGRRLVKT